MAPRRRAKSGLTRMDAALDQMSSFGFPRQLVRKTVTNLLKLYGDDGWKLIEEDGYKVLLDVILDEQETAQTQNPLKDAPSQQDKSGKDIMIAESNEVAVEVTSLEKENHVASLTVIGVETCKSTEIPVLPIKENEEVLNDVTLDKTADESPLHTFDDHSADKVTLNNSSFLGFASDKVHAPVNVTTRKRKPCYGWISDDDGEDENLYFISLTPST